MKEKLHYCAFSPELIMNVLATRIKILKSATKNNMV
jgi:hypothetical protein